MKNRMFFFIFSHKKMAKKYVFRISSSQNIKDILNIDIQSLIIYFQIPV